MKFGLIVGIFLMLAGSISAAVDAKRSFNTQVDELNALWSLYRFTFIRDGRVVEWDENQITTSEAQGYALLRSVWMGDRETFGSIWKWTRENLQTRDDKLFSWKWKGRVLDRNSATDADTDIALSLILAARQFSVPEFSAEAHKILADIWEHEVLEYEDRALLTAGNWAVSEKFPTIHVAYLAPYAYEVFAEFDPSRPWRRLIDHTYDVYRWIFEEMKMKLPPEIIFFDLRTGNFTLTNSSQAKRANFSYDAFPAYWRLALDAHWFHRREAEVRNRALDFFDETWAKHRSFRDRYKTDGTAESTNPAQVLYATLVGLADYEGRSWADPLREEQLAPLWEKALSGNPTPYYLHNWLWFSAALDAGIVRHYGENFSFLRPFDYRRFTAHFPWVLLAITLLSYALSRFYRRFKIVFLGLATLLCARYLGWRIFHSLNFLETAGPFVSLTLLGAEIYSFSTVLLLWLQVGLSSGRRTPVVERANFQPPVDILIPIYSESAEILETTLIGAVGIRYANKQIFVCDDSHRPEIASLAARYGAAYFRGPKSHAKAGNLNAALKQTKGDLVAIFDTDHIPVNSFLRETVPLFTDDKIGFVQTPHHFYNGDVFQRAFGNVASVPNEQDMFNHGIQAGRDSWGGAFFVGSGAVFRRSALESIGGFNLLSITEDIHTSQCLHGRGWKSAFVDKDLAVGLSAENLSSYIVQRRRWMLGCLQIFFRDNPLLRRNLNWRLRLGYFASLYYFFFPLARIVFWLTPIYYLLFHWHPLLADISELLAYLVPFAISLPLMTRALLPRWPRLFWGPMYEAVVTFPLFRSIFDLLLPKRLGFKVTPKGITSEKRVFDWPSSRATLVAVVISCIAIGKGAVELAHFGIEKEAYFFNLSWAVLNTFGLAISLWLAWERPQRRKQERVPVKTPFELRWGNGSYRGCLRDISLDGAGFIVDSAVTFPTRATVTLEFGDSVTLPVDVVWNDRVGEIRCGLRFRELDEASRRKLIAGTFADPATWNNAHTNRAKTPVGMAIGFGRGLLRSLGTFRPRVRREPRRRGWQPVRVLQSKFAAHGYIANTSPRGFALVHFGRAPVASDRWLVYGVNFFDGGTQPAQPRWVRSVYRRKIAPFVWRTGVELTTPPENPEVHCYVMA